MTRVVRVGVAVANRRTAIACLWLSFLLAGCAFSDIPFLGDENGGYSQQQLRSDLVTLANNNELRVTGAARTIKENTTDRQVRENTLRWQMAVLPGVRRLAFLSDPRQGFVAMLIVSQGLREYLESGEGRDLFGPQQPLAVQVSRLFEEDVRTLGGRFLPAGQLAQLQKEVDDIVRTNPIRGSFAPDSLATAIQHSSQRAGVRWVMSLPMVPVRALTGVSDTAQAINDFTDATRYLTDVAAQLPQEVRWQTEMLLYDFEDRDSVTSALSGWQELNHSVQRLAAAADRLPDDFRAETALLLGELDRQQVQLRETLAAARTTIEEVERAIQGARDLAEPFGTLAGQVGEAGGSWTEMLREIRAMQGSGDDGSATDAQSRGFDILEYEATAREITSAATGVRELLRELRELVDAPGLSTTVSALSAEVERAEAGGRSVVDHAAWRAFQLILFFFVALALYRVATARLAR